MDDERCRITVVGARRRVDLAVPARAPIAEYISSLTRMCGQETDEAFPAAWSLAPAGQRPIRLSTSLLEAQVVDGATLYLRDIVEGETDEPIITDVEELVEEAGGQWVRWDSRHRALTLIGIGIGVLVTAVAVLVLRSPRSPLSGFAAVVSGVGLALTAGFATRRGWPVPRPLRLATALAACPVLALAGYAIPIARESTSAAAIAIVAGADIGALAALLAVLDVCTLLVGMLAVLALPVTILLSGLRADLVQCAAAAGVVALAVLSSAPNAAGRLVTLVPEHRNSPLSSAEEISSTMSRSRNVLIALVLVLSMVIAGSIVVLADSTDLFALGLALALSLALLAQAGQNNVPVAVMPPLAAGAVGLLALATQAPAHLVHAPAVVGPLAACLIGVVVLIAGGVLATRPARVLDARPSWLGSVGILVSAITAPLALGVFGVFQYLAEFGGRL